jgi:hypothetical protein
MILTRKPGGAWRKPEVSAFDDEAALQTLLAESPGLIPGVVSECVVATEVSVPGTGPADLVIVEVDGTITIVECKLASNPEVRREVVGQILAYAAGLTGISFHAFVDLFNARSAVLLADLDVAEREDFERNVELTLRDGRFRLVVAVDRITDELKQIVTYLNQKTSSDVEIIALELDYVRDGDIEALIPQVYGTESAQVKARTKARKWDRESLEAHFEAHCLPVEAASLQLLLSHVEDKGHHIYWGDGKLPSGTFTYEIGSETCAVYSIYGLVDSASLDVNFAWIESKDPGHKRVERFARQLAGIPVFREKVEQAMAAGFRKRPGFPAAVTLADKHLMAQFLSFIDELIGPDYSGQAHGDPGKIESGSDAGLPSELGGGR